jgi:hypothetical protein
MPEDGSVGAFTICTKTVSVTWTESTTVIPSTPDGLGEPAPAPEATENPAVAPMSTRSWNTRCVGTTGPDVEPTVI